MLDDPRAWIGSGTYDADEVALRFHHRLVLIHVFPNGNGRHARLVDPTDARETYLAALRAMDRDRDDVAALLGFARA